MSFHSLFSLHYSLEVLAFQLAKGLRGQLVHYVKCMKLARGHLQQSKGIIYPSVVSKPTLCFGDCFFETWV